MERRITRSTAVALCALVAAMVVAPTAAFGQDAAADQYLPGPGTPPGETPGGETPGGGGGGGGNNPNGDQNPGGGGGGGDNPSGDEEGAGGGAGPALSPDAGTGETDSGSLPFTGYPLTALLLIVILLLAGGLVLRFGPAGLQRLRSAYSSR